MKRASIFLLFFSVLLLGCTDNIEEKTNDFTFDPADLTEIITCVSAQNDQDAETTCSINSANHLLTNYANHYLSYIGEEVVLSKATMYLVPNNTLSFTIIYTNVPENMGEDSLDLFNALYAQIYADMYSIKEEVGDLQLMEKLSFSGEESIQFDENVESSFFYLIFDTPEGMGFQLLYYVNDVLTSKYAEKLAILKANIDNGPTGQYILSIVNQAALATLIIDSANQTYDMHIVELSESDTTMITIDDFKPYIETTFDEYTFTKITPLPFER